MPGPDVLKRPLDLIGQLGSRLAELPLDSPRYQPKPLPPADWAAEIIRPDDLLYLSVSAYNLRPVDHPGGTRLERIAADEPALLVYELPPQTIGEQAFFEPSPIAPEDRPKPPPPPGAPPEKVESKDELIAGATARARIGRPVRLVFRVRDDTPSLALTLEGLLNWDPLEPVLAPLAMLPREPTPDQLHAAPSVTEPAPLQTAIELPYRLMLSPGVGARWTHSTEPVTRNGRTELWHSRLGELDEAGVLSEASASRTVPLRAIWSPDFAPGAAPPKDEPDPDLGTAAMNPNDRHQIVTLTSDYANFRRFQVPPVPPSPIEANQLMLSALGGWLRSSGHWELPEIAGQQGHGKVGVDRELRLPVGRAIRIEPGFAEVLEERGVFVRSPDDDLDLTEWVHVGTQGRDHYVRLVYDGCLFPFGHRASLVKITERRFEEVNGAPVALMRQFVYVVVRQPLREYPRNDYPNKGREMPFTRVQVKTLITPHLKQPNNDAATPSSFWMRDNATNRDVPFELVGFDAAGRAVPLSMPLIFVRRGEKDVAAVAKKWSTEPSLPGGSGPRRRAAVNGALMDFAPNGPAGSSDSILPARALYFGITGQGGCGEYLPTLFKAEVSLPSVEQLVGPGGVVTIGYVDAYLEKDFDANVGLFAHFEKDTSEVSTPDALALTFKADQAGGIATPNVQLRGLSTKRGPLAGELSDAVKGHFDPKKFFGGLPGGKTSLLFGAFSLGDILDGGSLDTGAPSINTHIVNDPARGRLSVAHYAWKTKPIRSPAPPGPAPDLVSFQPGDGSRLSIDAQVETALAGGASQSRMTGKLVDFRVEFFKAVTLHFDSFTFSSVTGAKLDVNVALSTIDPIVFGGDLDFVRKLSELIPPGVFGDGPSLDVRPDMVALGFAIGLPPLTVGVFTMKDLGLSAGLQLPFADGRPVLDFGFSTRQSPFLLTVSLLGGGGFFHLQLDTSGLKLVEAALEFGASVDLDIGVASGNVHVFAGIYFKLEKRDAVLQVVLAGYLRLGGAVSVLGLVTISIELNLSFSYDSGTQKVTGRATLNVNVEVAFFHKSVELSVERSFGRDGGDPTFGDLINSPAVWEEYSEAFA